MQNAIFQWPDEERMTKYAYNCNFSMITHDRTRYEYIRKLQEEEEEAERGSHVRQLTESEKEALIEGLKAKWEKVNTDYQATTHITKLDTIGKVRRKEQYEALLTQIEKDIEKLHKRTVVVDLTY